MYKVSKLNPEYSFNLNGDCLKDGKEFYPNYRGIEYEIPIKGRKYIFDPKQIALLTWYEVSAEYLNLDFILTKIHFVKCDSNVLRLRCGYLMVFSEPYEIIKGFRIIPGFTNYAINKFGDVISLVTGRILTKDIGGAGYPVVRLIDVDKPSTNGRDYGCSRSVGIHILIARTFIKNNNPSVNWFVNHRDGDKGNYSLTNLEWTTSKLNNEHAVLSGLNKQKIGWLVKNIKTDEIKEYRLLDDFFKEINYRDANHSIYLNQNGEIIPKLFKSKYEIKSKLDQREWYYTKKTKPSKALISGSFIEAKSIATGKVYKTTNIVEMSRLLNVPYMRINRALNHPEIISVDGYLVRISSEEPWPEKWRVSGESNIFSKKEYKLINITSGEIKLISTKRKLIKFLHISNETLNYKIKHNLPINGWLVEDITEQKTTI